MREDRRGKKEWDDEWNGREERGTGACLSVHGTILDQRFLLLRLFVCLIIVSIATTRTTAVMEVIVMTMVMRIMIMELEDAAAISLMMMMCVCHCVHE